MARTALDTRSGPPPGRKLTYEKFLEWCDEDTWAEWVDGEVVLLEPATLTHQQILGFLLRVDATEATDAAQERGRGPTA